MASNSVNRYFEGLLVGGALGFIAGLLTAPKRGAELRKDLADTADDLLNVASDQWADMKDTMSDRVQPFADKAMLYRDKVAGQASTLKDKVNRQTSTMMDQASAFKDRLSDKAESLKDRLNDKASDIKDKLSDTAESIKGSDAFRNGKDLVNNYMGNNSGPMYTAGAKASPDSAAHSVSDSCSTYEANQPEASSS